MTTLEQKEQQLDLILALDSARDSLHANDDPASMFRAILHIIRDQFQADACAIMLVDEPGHAVEMIETYAISDSRAIELCHQATELTQPGPVLDDDWQHTLGLQVIMGDKLLGSIFLARQEQAFDQNDHALLTLAESQIDSAIIQARLIWTLGQRNRELEAIYQIDRLRDSKAEENELIGDFTTLLIEYFEADLCMVILSHIDSGEFVLRGIFGKNNLSSAALKGLSQTIGNITVPTVIPTPPGLEEIILLAAPLVVAGVRLGGVIIGRKRPFINGDTRMIYAMTSQMDSAIVYTRIIQQLTRRTQELEIIYGIDKIRDNEHDFDRMLQSVLSEICRSVSSEIGYLMLYNGEEEELELKAATTAELLSSPVYYEVIVRVSRNALEEGGVVYSNRPDGPVRSIIAIPLILNETVIGVFGTVNSSNPRGFSAEDRRMLSAITSQVDTAVFERLERRRMRSILARSVDPKALEHMLARADDTLLSGERVVLTVLFADLRDSTAWAERTEPEALVNAINIFLGTMTDVIFEHGGTLDKFVGDEVIAMFGMPLAMEDHAYRAVTAAHAMQQAHQQIREELAAQGLELPHMGIGISSGEVIAGEIGPPIRTDFTAFGIPVNLGSRLCNSAPGDQIYISQATYDMVKNQVEVQPVDPVNLKGLGEVPIYRLLHIRGQDL